MSKELFERWVRVPIEMLRQIENGDGAFAAFAIALSMYERFIYSKLSAEKKDSTLKAFDEFASLDFDNKVSAVDFRSFWDMYRVGIQHYFQPKNFTKSKDGTSWGWEISSQHGYAKYPVIHEISDKTFVIKIDPWKFVDHVLGRWDGSISLINEIEKASLGTISHSQMPPGNVSNNGPVQYSKDAPNVNLSAGIASTGNIPPGL